MLRPMSSRRARPRRTRLAHFALLGAAVLATVLPVAHGLVESVEAAHAKTGATAGPAFVPACPPDCSERAHRHQSHDSATCATCRLLHAPARAVTSRAAPLSLAGVLAHASTASCAPAVQTSGPSRPRGPPPSLSHA